MPFSFSFSIKVLINSASAKFFALSKTSALVPSGKVWIALESKEEYWAFAIFSLSNSLLPASL